MSKSKRRQPARAARTGRQRAAARRRQQAVNAERTAPQASAAPPATQTAAAPPFAEPALPRPASAPGRPEVSGLLPPWIANPPRKGTVATVIRPPAVPTARRPTPAHAAHRVRSWRRLAPLDGWPGSTIILGAVGLVGGLALAGALDGVAVDRGPVLWLVVVLAGVGAVAGLARHTGRWWLTWGLGSAVAAGIGVALAQWYISASGMAAGSPYPASFLALGWIGLFALFTGISGWRTGPHTVRTVRILSGPAAVLAVFLLINSFYGYWPTVGTLLGHPLVGQVSKQRLAQDIFNHQRSLRGTTLGEFGEVDIPGTAVGFRAAVAYLWIPPDFDRVPHAHLPVIVTLTGIPGTAQDWARAGGALEAADAWAATHHGEGPVILMINQNGAADRDTECLDSPQGQSYRYLTQVVPKYLTGALGISQDADRWAWVGFSEGGTCALDLALTDHGLMGRFVDIAGDAAPDLVTRAEALRILYGGSQAAEQEGTPKFLLSHHRYPGLEGWFAAGLSDRGHHRLEPTLAREAARAGIDTHLYLAPGDHSWIFARSTFECLFPSLMWSLSARGALAPGQ